MKTKISSNNAPQPIGPYSQAIKINNLLFISGQIAMHSKTGNLVINKIEDETELVMENLKNILLAANCSLNDVIKCSIFLSNMDDFEAVNKIYGQYFSDPYPARETIEVKKLPKNVNVEISAIAMCK
tara:strand:- start:630 stop:1010 length:381 start_codon:yes stop_codon:yes gene_type:complete